MMTRIERMSIASFLVRRNLGVRHSRHKVNPICEEQLPPMASLVFRSHLSRVAPTTPPRPSRGLVWSDFRYYGYRTKQVSRA
jgi:hypothetical protein